MQSTNKKKGCKEIKFIITCTLNNGKSICDIVEASNKTEVQKVFIKRIGVDMRNQITNMIITPESTFTKSVHDYISNEKQNIIRAFLAKNQVILELGEFDYFFQDVCSKCGSDFVKTEYFDIFGHADYGDIHCLECGHITTGVELV